MTSDGELFSDYSLQLYSDSDAQRQEINERLAREFVQATPDEVERARDFAVRHAGDSRRVVIITELARAYLKELRHAVSDVTRIPFSPGNRFW